LTFAPFARRSPARGFCEITRPVLTRAEKARVTRPTEQWRRTTVRFAAATVAPLTRGTTQIDAAARLSTNVAVTACAAFIVSVQAAVPEQSPDQPENLEPRPGLALSVTEVPGPNVAEHTVPQSIPAGVDVTLPVPLPAFVTVSALGWE
jgi:hypothetical protein